MKLIDIISNIQNMNIDGTIYAKKPWDNEAQAIVAVEPIAGGLPSEAQGLQLVYFLEVSIAQEFLEQWIESLSSMPSDHEKCQRIIQYAINDA